MYVKVPTYFINFGIYHATGPEIVLLGEKSEGKKATLRADIPVYVICTLA